MNAHGGGVTEANRNVSVRLTRKEAELMRHRAQREMHLVYVEAENDGRRLTEDERANMRRYRRIVEQVGAALIEAGYE